MQKDNSGDLQRDCTNYSAEYLSVNLCEEIPVTGERTVRKYLR